MLDSAHVYVKNPVFECLIIAAITLLGTIADVDGEAVVGIFYRL
jgi:hypothetical protein